MAGYEENLYKITKKTRLYDIFEITGDFSCVDFNRFFSMIFNYTCNKDLWER